MPEDINAASESEFREAVGGPEAGERERLRKIVKGDIDDANAFYNEKTEPVLRERHSIFTASKRYYARRFEVLSEQSDFVSYDFWSFVQWAIPSVMNSFFGTDEAVTIVGRNSEDVPRADVMKKLIDYQLMTQNKGFLVLWDWFSDAFQYDLGAVKVWWKRKIEFDEPQVMSNAPSDRLMQMQSDPMVQILDVQQDPFTGLSEIQFQTMRYAENRPVIEPVQVTDLRWSRDAKSLCDANFVAHRKLVTADHLHRMAQNGTYEPEAVREALDKATGYKSGWNTFEDELRDNEIGGLRNANDDPARDLYELYECYVKVDANNDGILEDMLVTMIDDVILRAEPNPWGRVPIFTIAPVRDPFRVLSPLSLAEIVGEPQSLKVAMLRQIIVNTANVNNLQQFIDTTKVNQEDLAAHVQYIRVTGDPHTAAVNVPQGNLGNWTMPVLEYFETLIEQWTSRTRYNQGLESDSLNKTATGINLLQQASEQRMDYIVRVFAETGVSELFRFLIELNQRYIDQPQVIRLENQMLQISTDDLKGEFDIDVNTQVGVGKRRQTIQNMQFFLSAIAPTGMQIGAVTPGEWARAAQKLLAESGERAPEQYVLDPEVVKQQFFMNVAQNMLAAATQPQPVPEQGNQEQSEAPMQ